MNLKQEAFVQRKCSLVNGEHRHVIFALKTPDYIWKQEIHHRGFQDTPAPSDVMARKTLHQADLCPVWQLPLLLSRCLTQPARPPLKTHCTKSSISTCGSWVIWTGQVWIPELARPLNHKFWLLALKNMHLKNTFKWFCCTLKYENYQLRVGVTDLSPAMSIWKQWGLRDEHASSRPVGLDRSVSGREHSREPLQLFHVGRFQGLPQPSVLRPLEAPPPSTSDINQNTPTFHSKYNSVLGKENEWFAFKL